MKPTRMQSAGFTIIELLIAVAIVGILASVAVYSYTSSTTRTKFKTEVAAMFAEFQLRQEQYHAENGTYLSTAPDEATMHPPGLPSKPNEAPRSIEPFPAEWIELRVQPQRQALYCSYVSIAGPADGGTVGGEASGRFGMTILSTNWFYILARCDADGSGDGNDSFYFMRSDISGLAVSNEGK